MEKYLEFLKPILENRILDTLFLIIIAILLIKLIKKIFVKNIEIIDKKYDEKDNRHKTYVKSFSHILRWIIAISAFLLILYINGVNVTAGLASLGIVSVIIGLALQDAFKDLIMGANIITNKFYTIGDVIRVGEYEGKVTDFNLKVTRIKDVNNGNVLIIANRNIDKSLILSTQLDIDIPIKHNVKVEYVEQVIDEIITLAKENKNIKSIQYMGINEFGSMATYYKIRMKVIPELKNNTKRFVNRIIKIKLEEHGIEIPCTQIEIYGVDKGEKLWTKTY